MAPPLPKSKRQYVQRLNTPARAVARELHGAEPGKMPGFITPLLATLWPSVPAGEQWLHEMKFDGYRLQLHKIENISKLYTRRGYDWARKMPAVTSAAYELKASKAIIDGEVVVLSPDGTTDFNELERELAQSDTKNVVYFAFDLLFLDMWDMRKVPLLDRKRALAALLEPMGNAGPIRYSEHLPSAPRLLDQFCKAGLEGVVSKRANSRYVSGRTDNWVKVTCRKRDTFAIVGWALKGSKFDGFYLGEAKRKRLVYAGKIEGGWDEREKNELLAMVEPLYTGRQSLAVKIDKPKAKWVEPRILVDVEYRARTKKSGLLRHPSFKGVRRDLMEAPRKRSISRGKNSKRATKRS